MEPRDGLKTHSILLTMSKLTTLFTTALLLSFMLTDAAPSPPPCPNLSDDSAAANPESAALGEEISCEGISEEECLTRRNLMAHTDYVYTCEHNTGSVLP
ncbi:hypothetical protein K2173_007865 [Erythroxylum novogranatense]|uniref:Phytosulfokine n=1 Tax=Erythroxylum novogranatense TaxID=1862640 RepID=A0AAV8T6L8_9ROSI|nr:hypothetical protein K2173_007865 [Erythroxylum novogranatense]